ncbi:hypothetical protein OR1_03692 [Geobacter sp. OR-1]|uniref:hypothetical protein n=1 Tax=Geobacter sp. OR-1 TaxID=1266765 RepID=UPI0005430E98|nr:hypothetical protein [Geobacter sp. OR-1]GAM11377.1 hypothetical protein OR1_03692 [Geobacter sp. OR-1]
MKRPYLIAYRNGDRIAADFVFRHKDGGACFVCLFWDLPEGKPFRVLDGPVFQYERSWHVGEGVTIRELTKDDPEWSGWEAWQEYKSSPEGRRATDELGIAACLRDGAIID